MSWRIILPKHGDGMKFYEKLGFIVYREENRHYKMVYKGKKTCKNCGADVTAKYCPVCGQKTSVGRISIKLVLHDFFHVFTHVDSGILFLIKEQFIRPGNIVKEYLEGKRKKYFSPFQYLLIGVAISTFFTVNFDLGADFFGKFTFSGDDTGVILQNFVHYVYKFFNIIIFVTVPLLALYSKIFFPKAGFNYAEHLTLNTFVLAQRQVLFIIVVPFLYFYKSVSPEIMRVLNLVWAVFFIWTYLQFFRQKYKLWVFIKSLSVFFLFLVTNAALVGAVYFIFFR